MSVIDEILEHNEAYVRRFDKGELPMPPAKQLACVVCMDARLETGMLTFTDHELKQQILEDTGMKPPFALESFDDLDADVRQSIARIKASPYIPHKDDVRGFVYDVRSGHLREVD